MDGTHTEFTLEVFESPNVSFIGKKLASVSSEEKAGYRGELAIYQTDGGRYVCAKRIVSCVDNAHHEQVVAVCDAAGQIGDFFGYDQYAKMLYAIVDIDMTVHVD